MSKDAENRVKHSVDLAAGLSVLENSRQSLIEPPHFEGGEERVRQIGPSASGEILVIVVSIIEPDEHVLVPAMRIISVRHAEPSERAEYMKNQGLAEDRKPSMPDPENPPLKPGTRLTPASPFWKKRAADQKAKIATIQSKKPSKKLPDAE